MTVPAVPRDLYRRLAARETSLIDLTYAQHELHEARRWSVVEALAGIDLARLSPADRDYVWNAGRAELTTKPGADRLARLADSECRRWLEQDPALAAVLQAVGTWSRYWNEEEAHHEVAFNRLARSLDLPPVPDAEVIEFRQIFPDDDPLRTFVLLAISEITAATRYGWCASVAQDPGLAALFRQVAADEMQHMRYFLEFARALLDSGHYRAKDALAVVYLFVRDGGEVYGHERPGAVEREHVNWWDQLRTSSDTPLPPVLGKQRALIFEAVRLLTGRVVRTVDEVEETWMELVGC